MTTKFKYVLMILLAAVLVLPGCGGSKSGDSVEDIEDIVEADTATIDQTAQMSGDTSGAIDPNAGISDSSVPADMTASTDAPATAEPSMAVSAPETPSHEEIAPEQTQQSVAGSGEMASYRVKRGDTLMKIAFQVYGDVGRWKEIYNSNSSKLKNANQLAVGMKLAFEKPVSDPSVDRDGQAYLIKTGDTLGTIAYDVYAKANKWRKIWENNRTLIKNPNKIFAGFYLYYQITEAERQEAERIKASKGQQLGSTAPQQEQVPQQAAPVQQEQAATGLSGLDSLAAPQPNAAGAVPTSQARSAQGGAGRTPASARQ